MRLHFTSEPVQNVQVATLALLDLPGKPALTLEEQQQLAAFGEFTVTIGGVTLDPAEGANWVMPERTVSVPSSFPIVQRFDLETLTNGASIATAWKTHVQEAIDEARTAWIAQSRTGSDSVVTLPL